MMGDFKYVLVFMVLMSIGFFSPKPLDDLTVNLNLNESPKGHSAEIQKEVKTAKTSSQTGKKRKPKQNKPNVKPANPSGRLIKPTKKTNKPPGKLIKPTTKSNKSTDSTCSDVHQKREKPKRRKTRILNGLPVKCPPYFGEPPWVDWIVSMLVETAPAIFDKCSGALISRKHVLTALHCVENKVKRLNDKMVTVEPEKVKIFVTSLRYLEGKELKAGKIFYKNNDLIDGGPKDDIALIKLNEEIPKEVHVNPIALPERALHDNDEYWMAGWGLTETNPQIVQPKDLKQFLQTKKDRTICPNSPLLLPPEKQLCFNRWNYNKNVGHGACAGDSGSPGVISSVDPNSKQLKWYLQGVHSGGFPADPKSSGRCNETKSYGLDMSVLYYKDSILQWIKL